ncbi:DUF4351 domain-containing protein [Thiorhodococcus mannitoliphagus]|uniref:DUF4351 domain-containing protein n=1 Tax=Thiorhodococcus mannitoliphagus TaxID=329406 RepID=A0A6P1DVK3_9GAMM|nr:DUF4351 domain-containing protein [Thiorhodococcus mannitoliphagus]
MEWTEDWKRQGLEEGRRQGWQEGWQEGRQEGRQEGECSLLERQLIKRFGPLDVATRARLRAAGTEQLEAWAERILDANRLDDVFNTND